MLFPAGCTHTAVHHPTEAARRGSAADGDADDRNKKKKNDPISLICVRGSNGPPDKNHILTPLRGLRSGSTRLPVQIRHVAHN